MLTVKIYHLLNSSLDSDVFLGTSSVSKARLSGGVESLCEICMFFSSSPALQSLCDLRQAT